MNITYKGQSIPIFNLLAIKRAHSDLDIAFYSEVQDFILKTERYGYAGTLLPESNGSVFNPWFFANLVVTTSKQLLPFIAINPDYMHPFYTAKYIANISTFYNRPIYLNYITGTGLFDSSNLGNKHSHNAKYDRLEEYLKIVNGLLSNNETAFTFKGEFYDVQNLKLAQGLKENIKPVNFIAGNSEACLNVIKNNAAARLAMATTLEDLQTLNQQRAYNMGFHFGIVARTTDEEARKILPSLCPENVEEKRALQQFTTAKSKVVWKKELLEKAALLAKDDVYNLSLFADGCCDVPYLVGSYESVAKAIFNYIENGMSLAVIEIPDTKFDEFPHLGKVFDLVKEMTNKA